MNYNARNKGSYCTPDVEIIDVATEKGFANSPDSPGYGEEPVDNGEY